MRGKQVPMWQSWWQCHQVSLSPMSPPISSHWAQPLLTGNSENLSTINVLQICLIVSSSYTTYHTGLGKLMLSLSFHTSHRVILTLNHSLEIVEEKRLNLNPDALVIEYSKLILEPGNDILKCHKKNCNRLEFLAIMGRARSKLIFPDLPLILKKLKDNKNMEFLNMPLSNEEAFKCNQEWDMNHESITGGRKL